MSAVLINGKNYSWSNVTAIVLGVAVVGITKIDYKRKQKKENNYGAGVEPISRGYGNKEYEGSLTIYTDEWKRIIAAAPGRDPLDIPAFDIQVSFSGDGVPATRETLKAVEFLEDPFEASQDDTKLMVTIPLIIGAIKR